MRRPRGLVGIAILGVVFARLASATPQAPGGTSTDPPASATPAPTSAPAPFPASPPAPLAPKDLTRGEGMRAY